MLWFVFGTLARDYESGLRRMNESPRRRAGKGDRRRWVDVLAAAPPLRWWLRDRVSRASFLLVAAYLTRDRDVKLRVYPALAPMLVLPVLSLAQQFRGGGGAAVAGFSSAMTGGFLGAIPMLAIDLLKYSQQWRASDVFRAAPLPGPGSLCHGVRRAVLLFLVAPMVAGVALLVWLPHRSADALLMLLPGTILMPVFAVLANAGGRAVPLSLPSDEAKATGRGVVMIVAVFASGGLSVLALGARTLGWFWPFLAAEVLVSAALYVLVRRSINGSEWLPTE